MSNKIDINLRVGKPRFFKQSSFIKIIINTIIGVILVLIWLQFVNIAEIIITISKVDVKKLIPVFIFMFLSPFIRAIRLKIFLSSQSQISLKDLVFLNGIAMLFNYFIPIRTGEIAKGIYLNKTYNLPLGKSVIWIFLDRFIDFLVVIILVAILLLIIPTNLPSNLTFILTIFFLILLTIVYLMIYNVKFSQKLFKFLQFLLIVNNIKIYFERITNFFMETFLILRRKPVELITLLIITILAYGADAGIWYFSFIALDSHQNYINMYLGQLLSALTYLIPAAPGYIGSAEASGLLIFSGVFGINPNLASSMIVLFHILTTIFILVYGIVSVYFLKIDLGIILRRILRKEEIKKD